MVTRTLPVILYLVLSLTLIHKGYGQTATDEAAYQKKLAKSPVMRNSHLPDQSDSTGNSASPVSLEDFHYVPPSDTLTAGENGFFNAFRTRPGLALLSSAVVPGSGQLINHKYLRGALYLAVEAAAIFIHVSKLNSARDQEARYKNFANSNWSVEKYATWLVDYHKEHEGVHDILNDEDFIALEEEVNAIDNIEYGKGTWDEGPGDITLSTLKSVERKTQFVYTSGRVGNFFSHHLPDYGSQQYYELISKYYQFGPGWNDFERTTSADNIYQLHWDGTDMPDNWYKGARLAKQFNDSYKLSGNMLKLMVANHVISAFDAFFTVKLKQHKLKANATLLRGGGGLATLNYGF